MTTIEKLREKYNDYNYKSFQQRLKDNAPIETWMLNTMNYRGVRYGNNILDEWEICDKNQDVKEKNDIFQVFGDKTIYAQLKWRQPNSGSDIQVAVVQPYINGSLLKEAIKATPTAEQKFWARDMRFKGDFYVVLDNAWENLMVVNYLKIKSIVHKIFKEWFASDKPLGYLNRCYVSDDLSLSGVQLRWTKDKGSKGFDSGVGKLLCYINPSIFQPEDITFLNMVEPPDIEG